MSTVLELVQEFCREYHQPVPSSIQGNTDAGVQQYRALLNSAGRKIHSASFWQRTMKTVTWLSQPSTDQGVVAQLFPGMDFAEGGTLWDFTLRKPIFGPVPDQGWQALQAFMPGGPLYQYRFAGGHLEVNPALPAAHQLSMIYKNVNWVCLNGNTEPTKTGFTLDDDESIFAEELMMLGLRAKWLRAKQMPYLDEDQDFQAAIDTYASRDSVKPTVFMDSPAQNLRPGIWVPSGSWGVSP